MNNQFLTATLCSSPILVGIVAFVIFSKGDGETRIRNALRWFVSAISLPWLFWVWQSIESPNQYRAFWSAFAIYLPIWVVLVILENNKERYPRAIKILGSLIVLPWLAYALTDILKIYSERFLNKNVELMICAAGYGIFWILGLRVRDFEIKLDLSQQR